MTLITRDPIGSEVEAGLYVSLTSLFFLPWNRTGSTTSKNPTAVFLRHLPAFLPFPRWGGTVGLI